MGNYSYAGATVQYASITNDGIYDIVAYGARGGNTQNGGGLGGYGARKGGDFALTAGEKLRIVVGGHGGDAGTSGGGGGGTFVFGSTDGTNYTLLVAAGGGSGAYFGSNGAAGSAATTGDGNGGAGGQSYSSGGGGGAGVNAPGTSGSDGGFFMPGAGGSNGPSYAGGAGYTGSTGGGTGGFGGGGGGGYGGSGGGGGYRGGDGGAYGAGGGGTSYLGQTADNDRTVMDDGFNNDDGRVLITAVCFAAGTRIRTARGDVAVEHLAVGDLAITAAGAARPIRWLGHRTIDCRRHPRPHETYPIRIAAQAFAPSRPARDLLVSPAHAICVDVVGDVLIPAIALVNGSTIRQVEVHTVTYWHVELDDHDILLAENLPAESYIDCGNRSFFAEAGVVRLDAAPDLRPATANDYCRPFHHVGSDLAEVVRDRLCQRADALRAAEGSFADDCSSTSARVLLAG